MHQTFRRNGLAISVVGSFDRHNYGDLLFPLIVEEMVKQSGIGAELAYYATTRASMSAYGSKDAKSIRDLFGKPAAGHELVLVAGGEVLPAKWSLIVSYLVGALPARMINRSSSLVGDRLSSLFFSRLMGSRSSLPFVFAPSDFARPVRVAYNAVGGSHVKDESAYVRAALLSKLREAAYVSVRAQETLDFLRTNGIRGVKLAPDSAILVSQLYPLERLQGLITSRVRALCEAYPQGYICVQAGAAYSLQHAEEFRASIERLKRVTGLAVVVFAIGRATGHSDQLSFDIFRSDGQCPSGVPTVISDCDGVFDLMCLIAQSKLYVGTSLHGAITAASYGVPVLALCPSRVNKLQAFLRTWVDSDGYELAEFSGIDAAFDRLWAKRREGISARIIAAQQAARENFRLMLQPEPYAP